jgi:hypothetical protein
MAFHAGPLYHLKGRSESVENHNKLLDNPRGWRRDSPLNDGCAAMKKNVGTVICLLTAAACIFLFKTGHVSAFITLQITATVWLLAGSWVGDFFNAEHRALRHRSIREIYQVAKAGELPKETPVVWAMNLGGLLMLATAFIFFL